MKFFPGYFFRNIIYIAGLLTVFLLRADRQTSAEESGTNERFPVIYRITCLNSAEGCLCISPEQGFPAVIRFYHNESVHQQGSGINRSVKDLPSEISTEDLAKLQVAADAEGNIQMVPVRHYKRREVCLYPLRYLREYKYHPVIGSQFSAKSHVPLDLGVLAPDFRVQSASRQILGKFWATYYHLALEEHYPGPEVPILNREGSQTGTASQEFLKQVRWEGSGFRKNGDRIRWTGTENAYEFYYDAVWGYGAGYGYHVYPYRSIAVNFPGFCRRMFPEKNNCGKADIIGTLVYIEEVAEKKIPMEGGRKHDGYFCASDTGSPNFIKDDRIDIFTGVHGGGNPYLPSERQFNLLIAGGIENLIPSDWKLWTSEDTRVWCDTAKLPKDPKNPGPEDCTHDYHTQAAHKALKLYVFKNSEGKYIKCRPAPVTVKNAKR